MISEPLEAHGRGMHGYVLRYLSVDVFKLAIVVGYESKDKTFRVRLWRAATKQWTKTKIRSRLDELARLTVDEKRERARTIEDAIDAASDDLGVRAYA